MRRKDLITILEKRVKENLFEFSYDYRKKLDHIETETIARILQDLEFIQRSLKTNNPDSFFV